MKRTLFTTLLIILVGALSAQNQVRGTLADASNAQPLAYANCVLLKAADTSFAYGTTTDLKGAFLFKSVASGDYLFRVAYMGYEQKMQPVTVAGALDLGKLSVAKSATVLSTVKVTAEKPLYAMDGEKNMYNTKEDPSIQTGTASDALQNAPGVEVDAEGNITLRGVSSVEIWINDRPSHMNEEALKQYIKTMPANSIERIEVITNPSARYNSKGGVINIVTNQRITRNELLCIGLNGSTMPHITPWVSYVWANEKVDFNIYLNGSFSRHDVESSEESRLLNDTGALSRYQNYKSFSESSNRGGYMGFNFNWNIDSMTNLAAWMGAYPYWSTNDMTSHYDYQEYFPTFTDRGYERSYDQKSFGGGGYMGAWFQHRFNNEGRKLHASLSGNMWYSRDHATDLWTYTNTAYGVNDEIDTSNSTNWSADVEIGYTHPLKHDIELEAGVEIGYNTDGGYQGNAVFDQMAGSYVDDDYRCEEQNLDSKSLAAYLTAQKRWGNLTLKVGLRAQDNILKHDWSYAGIPNSTVYVDTSYFGLVPSLHLSYRTATMHNFSLSYTRRYSSPSPDQLSTFVEYDDYSTSTGNPNLRLSYTHNLEAAWNKYFMKFGSVGINAYFRANTDEIQELSDVAFDAVYHNAWVNHSYPVNIGNSHTEGLDANVTYRPTGFVNVRLNASVYNYAYSTVYRGEDISDSKLSYSFRLNVWAKLWKRLEVFANARYSSPRLGLYTLSNANKSIDFGVSSDFFDRKMSVYLNVNDIFGWSEWGSNNTNPYYSTSGSYRFDSRFVSLGVTLRFGKMELESKARQGDTETPSAPMQ